MKQESFGNIKNMQKQNRLFSLVYLINSRRQGRELVNIILITAGIVGNLANFLSLQQIGILEDNLFVLNTIINMVFLPLFAVILLQLLIGYFYQIEFFISIQWKIFRFLILPFLICYLLNESYTGSFLDPDIATIVLAIVVILGLALTATFATESYVYKKLLHRDLPINFHLLVVQILLYLTSIVQNHNIKITCALLLTILAYNIYNNNFVILKQSSLQYRILCVGTFLLQWYGMVLTITLFSEMGGILSLIVASIPCIFYKIVSDFTRQRAPVPYKQFVSMFEDPDTIDFESFIDSIQPIIEQIMQYYYSDNKKDFVETLLISYYYEHSNRCVNALCPFRNEDYKYELRNMNDSKNMKEVLFKICKKIDFLYYGMYKTWPQHIDLKLSLVQFYIFCFPNKVKALQIISEIQLSKLSLQQEYELFRVKILCQTMDNLQVVGEIKLDQRLVQFENVIYLTLNTMMEFWSLFYEQKIDFNKLTNITTKIFPLRKKIQEIFQSRLSQQTFSSLQILKLYSVYCGTIENSEQKSWKIKDYLQKLRSKLEQHKQIQYLSFDSEIGLVALSLSENRLGNVAMVNSQAANIFNYSKKQFKTIKVNQIMPKTFAQQHDNYLKVFLQNRNKKINSDERRLFGKNRAGYIFPILLQLQRTVSSTGDQLLFIANIKKMKLKQASISCVTDEEGEICDYSATFDYLFFRQERIQLSKKKFNGKNIQQFIPQFFDPNIEQDENTNNKHFKQIITLKNYGKMQIQYVVSSVAFPLKQNGGFVIQGKVLSEEKPLLFPHLSMTQSLSSMMNRQILSGHKTFYNPTHNRYELTKQEEPINLNDQFDKQFTIPFININDVTSIFGIKKQVVVYGENVKTIRLVHDHFQRVQEQSEFLTETDQQKTGTAQAISQIVQLKESILKQKKPTFMRNIKTILLALTISCVIICVVLVGAYKNYSNTATNYIEQVRYKYETRGYLSEYIIYFTALQSGFDQTIYESKLQKTKTQLINSIQSSPIMETKKQQIMKIVYLQSEANLTQLLNSQTLEFDYQESDSLSSIMAGWYSFIAIFCVLIVVTIFSYFLFLNQLQSIYQIFMCLQEKVIKKMYFQCKNLARKIELTSQKGNQKTQTQNTQFTKLKDTEQNDQDDQNPVKKIRKFKNQQKFRNLYLFLKLIMPFIFIIVLSIYAMIQISSRNQLLLKQTQIHKQILQIVPETSVFLMNTFLKNVHGSTTQVVPDFKGAYQDIDEILYDFEKYYPQSVAQSYFTTLLNDICSGKNYDSTQKLCNSIAQGTMTVGLSKGINYLANTLIGLQNSNGNNLVENFDEIIRLEYQFVFPVVEYMRSIIHNQLSRQADSFKSTYSTITVLVLILMVLNFVYFLRYPAAEIEQKIILSKGLVDLLPQFYKNQTQKSNEGYVKVDQQN